MIKKFIKKFIKNFQDEKKRMIGLSHLLNIRIKYKNITSLNEVDYKIFSQNGEDGIIDYILYSLEIKKPKFIEIGVGDYTESNTRFIFETRSLKGMVIDCISNLKKQINQGIKTWKGELTIEEVFISSKNILDILESQNFGKVDIFSIDIDGTDYWILNKLERDFSNIVILEYNSVFGENLEVTVPDIEGFSRNNYHHSNLCYGMSLKAAINLMEGKNFYFLGTNNLKNNAFFISKKFSKDSYFPNLKIESIKDATTSFLSESRDQNGNLNYIKGSGKINQIKDCDVVDLRNKGHSLKKIKEFLI
tara:strand:+ start:912 stop:1826 length:915 start_codon:yes stop_codon:yes gene_type:complete